MTKQTIDMVMEFHAMTGLEVRPVPNIKDKRLNKFRTSFIQEELNELIEALENGNRVGALDALIDLQYVLDGAFLSLGYYKFKNAGFEIVHFANMNKVQMDGTILRREDGKILKPIGWEHPNLEFLLPPNN